MNNKRVMAFLSPSDIKVEGDYIMSDLDQGFVTSELKAQFLQGYLPTQFVNLASGSSDPMTSNRALLAMSSLTSQQTQYRKVQHQMSVESPTSTLMSPTSMMPSPDFSCPPPPLLFCSQSEVSNQSSSVTSKNICAICGDRASGKHYSVFR